MALGAGGYRHLVSLQSASTVEGDYGEDAKTWSEYDQVYAGFIQFHSKAFYAAQQINSELDTEIAIRYRSDVKSGHRVVFESRNFEIMGPPVDARMIHRELRLMCKELT